MKPNKKIEQNEETITLLEKQKEQKMNEFNTEIRRLKRKNDRIAGKCFYCFSCRKWFNKDEAELKESYVNQPNNGFAVEYYICPECGAKNIERATNLRK